MLLLALKGLEKNLRRILLLSKTPEQGTKNGIGRKFIEINIAPKGYANEP